MTDAPIRPRMETMGYDFFEVAPPPESIPLLRLALRTPEDLGPDARESAPDAGAHTPATAPDAEVAAAFVPMPPPLVAQLECASRGRAWWLAPTLLGVALLVALAALFAAAAVRCT